MATCCDMASRGHRSGCVGRVAELEAEFAAERAWRKRVTVAGAAILDALHLSFGTHDAEQELRNALGSPVTPTDPGTRPKGSEE